MEEKSERPVNIKIGRKNIIERLSIAKFDILKFSFCGQYLAVKHQLYPTTLWIWNIIDDYLDYLLLENTIVGEYFNNIYFLCAISNYIKNLIFSCKMESYTRSPFNILRVCVYI